MDRKATWDSLVGCYIPMPTLFSDPSLELNLAGMRRQVRHLLEGGVRRGNGVLLVCGGAGEFPSLGVDERLQVAEAVIDEAGGKVGVLLGVQGTSQRDVLALAKGAKKLGAVGLQAAPPFYHHHTEDDVFEWIQGIGDAADLGIVFYTTYWSGFRTSLGFLERLATVPQVISIKWASPSVTEFEQGLRHFAQRFLFIDNQLQFVQSHMLGGRGVNVHPANYWPQWGVRFWDLLEKGQYREAQAQMTQVVSPYYDMHETIGAFTGGEGHLDKLCLELVGLDSSRCRPPIRDIRPQFRERVRRMLLECGVPGVVGK